MGEDKLGIAVVPIRATMDQLDKDLDGAREKVRKSTDSIAASVGKIALGGLAVGAAVAAAAMVGIGAAAFTAAEQVDDAMDTIIIRTGATGKELEDLKRDFGGLFSNFPVEAKDVAGVLSVLTQRIKGTKEDTDLMGGAILEASRMMKTDATQSASGLTKVMGAWNIQAADGADTMDKVFRASQLSGLGMDDLMQKMVQWGPTLRIMGFGFDESIAMFAKWEQQGVNSEKMMSALSIATRTFAKDAGPAAADGAENGAVGLQKQAEAIQNSSDKLTDLRNQLQLARAQQGQFNDKTKKATRLASQMKIDKLTREIGQEEVKLSRLSTTTTRKAVPAQKSLRDSFLAATQAIRDAKTETEAMGIGVEVFGRSSTDMVKAIREGRFSFEDFTKAIAGSKDAIAVTAMAIEDWPEKFKRIKNDIILGLTPLGDIMRDWLGQGLDALEPIISRWSRNFGDLFSGKITLGDFGQKIVEEINLQGPVIQAGLDNLNIALRKWATDPATQKANVEVGRVVGSYIGQGIVDGLMGKGKPERDPYGNEQTSQSVIGGIIGALTRAVTSAAFDFLLLGADIYAGIWIGIIEAFRGPMTPEQKSDYQHAMRKQFVSNFDPVGIAKDIWDLLWDELRRQLRNMPGGGGAGGGGAFGGYQFGGIVPGPLGAPRMALVHGGEKFTPASQVHEEHDHWNLTINSMATVENVAGSYQMMRSLAGV